VIANQKMNLWRKLVNGFDEITPFVKLVLQCCDTAGAFVVIADFQKVVNVASK
jgi:hypothetical protein